MNLVRRQITSNASPLSPRPWFEFTVDTLTRVVTITQANGLRTARGITQAKQDALRKAWPLVPSVVKAAEPHLLMVTLAGDVVFLPASEVKGDYYAHLGEYDPATDTLTLLEFVEPPP